MEVIRLTTVSFVYDARCPEMSPFFFLKEYDIKMLTAKLAGFFCCCVNNSSPILSTIITECGVVSCSVVANMLTEPLPASRPPTARNTLKFITEPKRKH